MKQLTPHASRTQVVFLLCAACTATSASAATTPSVDPSPTIQLDPVIIEEHRSLPPFGHALGGSDLRIRRLGTNDAAAVLEGMPGVSHYTGGGVSSLPVINGLGDDRLRISVDGMNITSACPNHMNPPLSYMDPSLLETVRLFAGIVPVSQGGDSIGGAISVVRVRPEFAAEGAGLVSKASLGMSARGNGNALSMNLRSFVASDRLHLGYEAASASADNYLDGRGQEVVASRYRVRNNTLRFAAKANSGVATLDIGWQDLPVQGFPNQPMDMVYNKSISLNAGYKGGIAGAALEARVFRQRVRHKMDILADKSSGRMPMDTDAADLGYSVVLTQALGESQSLRWGHEFHRYSLDDWWPALSGFMAPHNFWNIRDGQRQRVAAFAELDQSWNSHWSSQFGLRVESVRMDSGPVQGYHSAADGSYTTMMGSKRTYGNAAYQVDADVFNAQQHLRRDLNWDVTTAVRFTANAEASVDLGFSRKTRSPNLHERFAWSNESMMAGLMNNWFGDLNAYVGNLNLKPEVAYTIRMQPDWHDAEGRNWQLVLSPFATYVRDYINAAPNMSSNMYSMMAMRKSLQFVNQDAVLSGMDISGFKVLHRGESVWTLSGVISALRGRTTGADDLYNVMPLNGRLSLERTAQRWTSSVELQWVAAKQHLSKVRNELPTPGYVLAHLKTGYKWNETLRLDLALNNLFNRDYALPLGGLEFAGANKLRPTRGPGRAATIGFSANF